VSWCIESTRRPGRRGALLMLIALTLCEGTALAAAGSAAGTGTGIGTHSANAPDSGLFEVTPAPACANPMCYSADSLAGSRTHMIMINPDIVDTTHGVAHITADRAEESGPDIGDSDWVLTGHVRADMSDGQLRADRATIHMTDKRIASITAHGAPALFQRPAAAPAPTPAGAAHPASGMSNLSVHGHASVITYDAVHGQVQFTGDSWFTDGCNDIDSQMLTYDLSQQIVQAREAPGASGRVHGTIRNTRPGSTTTCTTDAGPS